MSTNQPRKPAGAPAGGQWAPMAHAEPEVDLAAPQHHPAVPPALGAIASGPDVLSRIGALPSPAKAQLERDVVLTQASELTAGDVELYERGQRLPMASVLEVARGTTETVEASETKLNETLHRLEP